MSQRESNSYVEIKKNLVRKIAGTYERVKGQW